MNLSTVLGTVAVAIFTAAGAAHASTADYNFDFFGSGMDGSVANVHGVFTVDDTPIALGRDRPGDFGYKVVGMSGDVTTEQGFYYGSYYGQYGGYVGQITKFDATRNYVILDPLGFIGTVRVNYVVGSFIFETTGGYGWGVSQPAFDYLDFSSGIFPEKGIEGFWGGGALTVSSVPNAPIVSAVPEPETYALLLAGLMFLTFATRRARGQ